MGGFHSSANSASDLEVFREYIRKIANGEWPSDIARNRDRPHASIVLGELFQSAEVAVKILTGSLNPSVYGVDEVIQSAVSYLRQHQRASVEILSESEIEDDHPFIIAIKDAALIERVPVWKIPLDVQCTYQCHFCVADGKHYRYEKSRELQEAFVRFGDSDFGTKLNEIFERVKSKSVRSHSKTKHMMA